MLALPRSPGLLPQQLPEGERPYQTVEPRAGLEPAPSGLEDRRSSCRAAEAGAFGRNRTGALSLTGRALYQPELQRRDIQFSCLNLHVAAVVQADQIAEVVRPAVPAAYHVMNIQPSTLAWLPTTCPTNLIPFPDRMADGLPTRTIPIILRTTEPIPVRLTRLIPREVPCASAPIRMPILLSDSIRISSQCQANPSLGLLR